MVKLNLYYIFSILVEYTTIWTFLKLFMDKTSLIRENVPKIKINVSLILIIMITSTCNYFCIHILGSEEVLFILITFLFYSLFYKEKFIIKIVFILFYKTLYISIKYFYTNIVLRYTIQIFEGRLSENIEFYTISTVLFSIIILFLEIKYIIFSKDRITFIKTNKEPLIPIMICISIMLITSIIIYHKIIYNEIVSDLTGYTVIILVYIISSFYISKQMISLVLSIEKNRDSLKRQSEYYTNIHDKQLEIGELYHDIRNHLICIKGLNNNSNALKYIDKIENKIKNPYNFSTTGNIILDILLTEKRIECDNERIVLSVNLNFSKCNFIDVVDVCAIFANMLDNAIEACMKIEKEKRFIALSGHTINEFYVIKLENSKVNKIISKNNIIITDKKNFLSHGIGIRSIKNTVKKYNGEVVINYTNNTFIIKLFIPLDAKKADLY